LKIAVIRFPGIHSDMDVIRSLSMIEGANPVLVLSREGSSRLKDVDAIVIPGGFSYGDYPRVGATASNAEIMDGVKEFAESGKPVLGISNGFQILAESSLLPGKLLRNQTGRFVCKWVYLKVCEESNLFTHSLADLVIRIPIAHQFGRYFCKDKNLEKLKNRGLITFRYCDRDGTISNDSNPDGSIQNIAGIVNEKGNVLGMMPFPDRACRIQLGSSDGLIILENLVRGSKSS
jgi:phosphoribosylformylglycinamidine synthase I